MKRKSMKKLAKVKGNNLLNPDGTVNTPAFAQASKLHTRKKVRINSLFFKYL